MVPKIFPNLNVVGHLAVPAGWGSCLPRLALFCGFLSPSPDFCNQTDHRVCSRVSTSGIHLLDKLDLQLRLLYVSQVK